MRYWRSSLPGRVLPIDESVKSVKVRLEKLALLPHFCTVVWRLCNREKPDILHAHATAFTAVAALIVGRLKRIPVVYELRSFYYLGKRRSLGAATAAMLADMAEATVSRRAAAIVVINRQMERRIRERWRIKSPILVVPNAVSTDDIKAVRPFGEGRTGRSLVLGYVGSFCAYEGLLNLVEAVALLRRAGYPNKLLLFGGGTVYPDLEERVNRLELEGVELRGTIPPDEVDKAYEEIDIVVNPRLSTEITGNVTPIKPLEAMAYGRLFLGADIGGIREVTRDGIGCILADLSSPEKIAERIRRLVETPLPELAGIAQRGSDFALRSCGWSANTELYRSIYCNLTNRRDSTFPLDEPRREKQ